MAGECGAPRCLAVDGLAAPGGHYSHAVCAGGFVFVSGQLPVTRAGARLTGEPFERQAAQALSNVETALLAAGSSIGQLVQVRVYLADIADWPAFNAIYAVWAGKARPTRAVVPAGALHFGLKIEVEAVAIATRNPAT